MNFTAYIQIERHNRKRNKTKQNEEKNRNGETDKRWKERKTYERTIEKNVCKTELTSILIQIIQNFNCFCLRCSGTHMYTMCVCAYVYLILFLSQLFSANCEWPIWCILHIHTVLLFLFLFGLDLVLCRNWTNKTQTNNCVHHGVLSVKFPYSSTFR